MHRFFSQINTVEHLSETDIKNPPHYLEAIKALERLTYASLYIIDYHKKAFEYVSENPLFLCGHTAKEVQQMGYEFYFKYVTAEDLDFLIKVNQIGFSFYEQIPLSERKSYTISYDFHVKPEGSQRILLHQKFTPLCLTETGKIWKGLCVTSLSTEQNVGKVTITKLGTNKIFLYNFSTGKWEPEEKISLSDREKEIIQLSVRGFTIRDIAEEIFVSTETIKFHRKKAFEKMGVTNIAEAISFATNNKLL